MTMGLGALEEIVTGNRTRQWLPYAEVNSPNHPPGTWSPDSQGESRPVGDLHAPLPSIIFAQNQLNSPPFPYLFFDHTQLSPPKTAVLQFNHLWMWVEVAGGGFGGVEAKTTHYIINNAVNTLQSPLKHLPMVNITSGSSTLRKWATERVKQRNPLPVCWSGNGPRGDIKRIPRGALTAVAEERGAQWVGEVVGLVVAKHQSREREANLFQFDCQR
ncbi:Photosystem I P700 chlorophyll a apoprotein A1 [Dissostichus eleginoides]|uniref:Photosystem I P700 chlorophyll a apoprotein A1 n=1 Tax=Dissostichus eleginoides TaxID=100907 RepID=A0AAD9C1X2_DISEL|nr:Photosystem I P700 chlorophyll a apoprotein A1 [Dissostichus eleginoides]